MKKLASFCLASIMAMSAASAADAPVSRVGRRVMVREYQPYTVETAKGWYMGGRLALSFLNFTNDTTVTNDVGAVKLSDDYSFETLFGGSVFAGTDFQL